MTLEGGKSFSDRFEQDVLAGMIEEAGRAPLGGLRCFSVADPAQRLLDPEGLGGGEAAWYHLPQCCDLVLGPVRLGGLEDRPAGAFGQMALLALQLAHVIHGLGEELHDVEPVHGHGRVLKGLAHRGQERRRHIANDFGDTLGLASPIAQEGPKALQTRLAFAGRGEDDGPLFAVQVDEDRDAVVPALAGRLAQVEAGKRAQVEPGQGLGHVVLGNAPDALVGYADEAGHGARGHLVHKRHDHLLNKQREAAAWPGPGYLDPTDTVLGDSQSWARGP